MRNLFFILFIFLTLGACAQQNTQTITFSTRGNCDMCKERIEHALDRPGIRKAVWNSETHQTTVTFVSSKISPVEVQKLIAAAGHDTEHEAAEAKTYKALPECCQYDRKQAIK